MTPMREIVEMVKTVAESMVSLPINLDEVPVAGGIYLEAQAGHPTDVYYSLHAIRVVPMLFICKSKDQMVCTDQLGEICRGLQQRHKYPTGNTVDWLDATIATEPSKIGRQEDGQYLYSCVINVKCYF